MGTVPICSNTKVHAKLNRCCTQKIEKELSGIDTHFRGDKTYSYSDQQKHESSCLFSDYLLCTSPEPLELQKVIYTYLHPSLKSFQVK